MAATQTTQGISITVKPEFWPERSHPESGQFAFTYTIEIRNDGSLPAQLRSRHWLITDGAGRIEEVRGDGVVGKQPKLLPGESFEYSSWAMLKTPYGSMRGTYLMVRPNGDTFEAVIPEFALTQPNALH